MLASSDAHERTAKDLEIRKLRKYQRDRQQACYTHINQQNTGWLKGVYVRVCFGTTGWFTSNKVLKFCWKWLANRFHVKYILFVGMKANDPINPNYLSWSHNLEILRYLNRLFWLSSSSSKFRETSFVTRVCICRDVKNVMLTARSLIILEARVHRGRVCPMNAWTR